MNQKIFGATALSIPTTFSLWGDIMSKNEELLEIADEIFVLVKDRVPANDKLEVKFIFGEGGLLEKRIIQHYSYEIELNEE